MHRTRILLVHHPIHCLAIPQELADLVFSVLMKTSRLVVLGDGNIHIKARVSGMAQGFMASMLTKGLPK